MSNNMNRVTVSGRITKDLVLNQTRNDSYIVMFDIACHYFAGTKDPDAVSFIPIRAFGKNAEFLGKYFHKGDEIYIDGYLREDRWEKEGQNRSSLYVLANKIFFGPPKKIKSAGEAENDTAADGNEDSDPDFAKVKPEGDLPF